MAQHIREGYVDRGVTGPKFATLLKTWEKGTKWSDDDNFFISRVKPHQRFRNAATQVNPELDETVDKNLIFWVPCNNELYNALPDGVFDSEIFPMWSYITHYGNWSAPLARMPGGFADVAHKNGVPISVLVATPFGSLSREWKIGLNGLVEAGADKLSDYLLYYGIDGLGYNSEFYCTPELVSSLGQLHEDAVKIMKGRGGNPLTEFIWYDGTTCRGDIFFDVGLGEHNMDNWGYGDNIRTSLFLNYNWNDDMLLDTTIETADRLGRSPLGIYCGINMQGREPKVFHSFSEIWTLLSKYPLSIGLWGAHSENMFFESRGELGASPMQRQRTYLNRLLNWFTNGSHNPIVNHEINNSLVYSAENHDFFGMSKMMTARSALKWDLGEEPFITYFNLGNGRFFNYKGIRQHSSEWYNISMQDYLPTWMWWFSSKFLGRESSDIVDDGLQAEFVWDDAWMGGSTIRIHGSVGNEYLHLFKTEFPLEDGDEIIFRYKLLNGVGDAYMALSVKGNEATDVAEESMKIMDKDIPVAPGVWIEKKFIVGSDVFLAHEEVAMIALHFSDVSDMDIRLGELSIKRPGKMSRMIESPVIESVKLLNAGREGVDGKIIFNMPNNKGNEVCYNSDVNTSFFKLYYQQKGCGPLLMGMTTSWAGLIFSAPYIDDLHNDAVRFGVSTLTLDHVSESEISWGEWMSIDARYEISDEVDLSKSILKPHESFSVGYVDSSHEVADWVLTDSSGNVLAEAAASKSLRVEEGVDMPGMYDLTIKGMEKIGTDRIMTTRILKDFIQITDVTTGDIPVITNVESLNGVVDESMDDVLTYVYDDSEPKLTYEFISGNATMSRGVHIGKEAVGFRFKDSDLSEKSSFSVGFWFKPESFDDKSVHMLNIRDKGDRWSVNNWGWFWHTLTEEGKSDSFSIRMASGSEITYHFDGLALVPGKWYHITYVFDFNDKDEILPSLYINGEYQPITSWQENEDEFNGTPGFMGPTWRWSGENVVALGGYLHRSGSVRGNVDNFMVWDKAITKEEVLASMESIDVDNLPDNLIGYFDFETDAVSDNCFLNDGRGEFKLGMHRYLDTETEGQGTLIWTQPEYCTGCPFVKGDKLNLVSNVSWATPGGKIIDAENTAERGYVRLSYPDYRSESLYGDGYPVRLTVSNEYGQDFRDMVIRFNDTGAVGLVENDTTVSLEVRSILSESKIEVISPADGTLRLSMTDLDGHCVLSNTFIANKGEILSIYPEVSPGLYILVAEKDSGLLGSAKVIL
ncbi:MAG: hypothetical protein K2H60_11150 [Muribaculaceae bacterium]|nr:hypothetical protein [Muribaculaceae bacterium]